MTFIGDGGVFTRLGHLFGLAKKIRLFQQDTVPTVPITVDGMRTTVDAFSSSAGDVPQGTDLVADIADEVGFVTTVRPMLERIKRCCEKTVMKHAESYNRIPYPNAYEALVEIAYQMNVASTRVEQTLFTIGAASYGSSNTGNAVVLLSAEAPKLVGGRVNFATKVTDQQFIRPETIRMTCVRDSRYSDIQSGSEKWRIQGEAARDNLDWRWPGGSGHDFILTQTCASVDSDETPGQNILANSDFEDFTSNLPDKWASVVGVAGTNYASTSTAFRGSKALSLIGDGVSTKPHIRQQVASQTGTTAKIKPDTLYLISFWTRHDGSGAPGGTVKVSVNDGSSTLGSMSVTLASGSFTSSYQQVTLKVVSPINIPATVYVSVELSVANTNGKAIYVDELVIAEMPRPAKGSWGLCITAAGTDSKIGDTATLAISYNVSGDMLLELDRFFDCYNNGLLFPSTAVATPPEILDSLIVNP